MGKWTDEIKGPFQYTKISKAIPANFDRDKKGDRVIREQLQILLEPDCLRQSARPLLTEDGVLKVKDGLGSIAWSEVVERAPGFFGSKYRKLRNREEYGRAVHGEFVRNSPRHRAIALFLSWFFFKNYVGCVI